MNILVDMDGVLYDMNPLWFALHNAEYGHIHELTPQNVTEWYVQKHCEAHGCPAQIYKYFNESSIWTDGAIMDHWAVDITKHWQEQGHNVIVVTTVPNHIAANRKLSWLHKNFPHLDDVIITTTGSLKSLISGDFLIDDRPDNHNGFTGISILYDAPYNQNSPLLRAVDWTHVNDIVTRGIELLDAGYSIDVVEAALATEDDL